MKGEMESFKHEMSMVHHVKDEMEDLRDAVDRMEDQCRRRKNHLLQQVLSYNAKANLRPRNIFERNAKRIV
jgi:hypothetical protein